MRIDPIAAVVQYLRSLPDLPPGSVKGDLNDREVGQTTVYVEHNGGFRMTRDRMDRVDILYEVYSLDREEAADLAYLVREKFLEDLPDTMVGDVYFLDTADVDSPKYDPDAASREHVYRGEVAVFYVEA